VNAPLFRDGAGAMVLGYTEERKGILASVTGSNPMKGNLRLIYDHGYLYMNGNPVFKPAVRMMSHATEEIMEALGWTKDDILLIPHQANRRIIDAVGNALGYSVDEAKEHVFVNIARYGNMSAATCPIALDEALRSGRITPGSKLVVVSFGSGFVWGAFGVQC
jgi:3-oxoacyl-[acyl-carrier-protein] synthase-3